MLGDTDVRLHNVMLVNIMLSILSTIFCLIVGGDAGQIQCAGPGQLGGGADQANRCHRKYVLYCSLPVFLGTASKLQ